MRMMDFMWKSFMPLAVLFISGFSLVIPSKPNTSPESQKDLFTELHHTQQRRSLDQDVRFKSSRWENPPSACFTADTNSTVFWDATASSKRCKPDVCGGADLTDIRDLAGRASVSNICAGPLFDSQRTMECLRGKSILFLGDSTLQEQLMDIAALLSQLAHNNTAFWKFVKTMAAFIYGTTKPSYQLPHGVNLEFHGGNQSRGRNFTVTHKAAAITLRFRFTGHHNPVENHEGISAFLHPSVLSEFMCEMALVQPQHLHCKSIDALVLNSGQHDSFSRIIPKGLHAPWFTAYLDSLLALLSPHHLAFQALHETEHVVHNDASDTGSVSAYCVVWRGNTMGVQKGTILADLDEIARQRVTALGIPFLDTAAIMKSTPHFPNCCTTGGIHIGSHEYVRYAAKFKKPNLFTASSLVTNALLRALCPVPHGVE